MQLMYIRRLLMSVAILVAAWLLINVVAFTEVAAENPTPVVTER